MRRSYTALRRFVTRFGCIVDQWNYTPCWRHSRRMILLPINFPIFSACLFRKHCFIVLLLYIMRRRRFINRRSCSNFRVGVVHILFICFNTAACINQIGFLFKILDNLYRRTLCNASEQDRKRTPMKASIVLNCCRKGHILLTRVGNFEIKPLNHILLNSKKD